MSSVQSFLKQRVPNATFFQAPTDNGCYYQLSAASGNIVGNYPPGFIIAAEAYVQTAIQAITTGRSQTLCVLRDMGKVIYAPLAANLAAAQAGTASGTSGYFRQVQLLLPQPITNSQGFIGGANGNLFGVQGSPQPYDAYLTFYLPVVIGGILASPATLALQTPAVSGAM